MNSTGVSLALLGVALILATSCAPPELPTTFSQGGRITTRFGDGETVALTSGPADLAPSVSPDGTKVAFVRIAPDEMAGTYVADTDGKNERLVAPSTAILSRPAWSPDSSHLTFRDIAQERLGIWTVAADGTNLRRIFQGNPLTPVWSPDGELIAFANGIQAKDGSVAIGLYVTDPQGNKPNLVAEGWYGETAWSPDGRRLAVVASPKDAPRALLTVDYISGENITLATNLAEGTWAPAWDPGAKDIAFVLAEENQQHLAVVSSTGGSPRILVSGKTIGTPVWSADGHYLTVAMDEDGTRAFEVVRLRADGSSPLQKLGLGEAPCSTPGSLAKPAKVVAAKPQMEGMRRAALFLVSGSWGWAGWATAVEEAAVSQPGVVHIEFLWPDKTGILIYDSNRTTVDDVIFHIKENKKREFTVVADRPFPW